MKNLNRFIDHTLLKPEATAEQIKKLCEEAKKYHFFSVCINPFYVPYAKELLNNTDVSVCTVIGFPLGANSSASKIYETTDALAHGAQEIDMVINIGAIKSGDWQKVEHEIQAIKKVCKEKILKVIFETCLLSKEEIIMAAQVSERAGADFIKTSTGFSTGGATIEDVQSMSNSVTSKVAVKASGGIRDYKTAIDMIQAGATRLGTSAGIAIMTGDKKNSTELSY